MFTKALPISNHIADVYSGIDQCALTAVLTKKAVDRVLNSKLEDAREAVLHKVQEIIQAFKTEMAPSLQQNQMLVSKSLNLFPAYMLGLFKHLALRTGSNIHPDVRTAAIFDLYMLSPEAILSQLYPRLYFLNQEVGDTSFFSIFGVRIPSYPFLQMLFHSMVIMPRARLYTHLW